MDIVKFDEEKKFSSVYLAEQINEFRKLEGDRKTLFHFTLLAKIEKEFDEEINDKNILVVDYVDAKGEKRKCYELTFEQSLQLLMSESKLVRKGVINKLKEQHEVIKQLAPKTYKEALLALIQKEEEKERLELQLTEQAPKVEFYDKIIDNDGLISISEACRVLQLPYGRNILFKKLRDMDILMEKNIPYQRFINDGYFACKEVNIVVKGTTIITLQTYVTQKGLDYLIKKLK